MSLPSASLFFIPPLEFPVISRIYSFRLPAMTHIAIQEKRDGKVVDWLEHVSDEQYRARK
ncbi:MAG: Cupin [Candidatus Acidoferrum typicum]|nr:Cupin [Candidatus Acidoferrum typicum]